MATKKTVGQKIKDVLKPKAEKKTTAKKAEKKPANKARGLWLGSLKKAGK